MLMRPNAWNRTLSKLGFVRRKKRKCECGTGCHRSKRNMQIENLESRELLTVDLAAMASHIVQDNTDTVYSEVGGNWQSYSDSAAYDGAFRYHAGGDGSDGAAASWGFGSLDPTKSYQVFATWSASSNRASNAPYTILDDTTSLATVQLNQQFTPNDATGEGTTWQSLGTYTASSGTLNISLGDAANGYVIADAICVAEVPSATPVTGSVYSLNATNNWTSSPVDSYQVRNDSTNKVVADDFVLEQNTSVQQVVIHGSLNQGFNGLDPTNVVVTFYSSTTGDSDTAAPNAVLKTITVAWEDCTYNSTTGQLTVDFSGDEADWFAAAAGTRYWLSVQPTVYDSAGSFRWNWAADTDHPSSSTANGSSAVVLDSLGNWVHEGRWWRPGDWLMDATWVVQSYSGDLPSTITASGQTATDGQRLDLNFELFGTTTSVAASPTLVDNADSGYAETGSNWLGYSESGAFETGFRYHAAGTGTNTANWTFTGLDANKQYQVYVTWSAASNRATNSPFTVSDGTTSLATVRLNQQFAAGDATIDDRGWESVGVYTTSSGTLRISLSDDANGYVIADAVRIVEVPAVTTAPAVVDEGDSAYVETGSNWLGYSESGNFNGDFRYHAAGDGSNTAAWTIGSLPVGVYQVYASWSAGSNRATNTPYTIYDGSTSLGTVRVNQQSTPNDLIVAEAGPSSQGWASLGTYTIENGTLRVVLSDDANGIVIADSIRLVQVNQAPSFEVGADQTVTIGADQQTVSNFVSSISAGAANEAGQTVSFVVSVDHPELFATLPTIDDEGNLVYTPSASATGVAVVSVYAQDDGGTLAGGQNTSAAQTFTITVSAAPTGPTSAYDLNATNVWSQGAAQSNLQNGDTSVNYQVADDFVLSRTTDIQKITVHGNLSYGFNEQPPLNVVVTFWANNGESDVDAAAPGTVLKTITVAWSQCTYDSETKLLTVDFTGTEADWFRAEAGTRYWLSVQPTVYDGMGGFRVYWNNDASSPSTYSSVGSSAVVLDSSGNWVHEGRWWRPGDWLLDDTWAIQSYSGSLPATTTISGQTSGSGQRLDMSFELFGTVRAPEQTLSGAASAAVGVSYGLTLSQPSGTNADLVDSYLINWGDGTTPLAIAANELPSNRLLSHTYASTYSVCTITVTMRDGNGTALGVTTKSISVTANDTATPSESVYDQAALDWSSGAAASYLVAGDATVNHMVADDFTLAETTDINKITVHGTLNLGFNGLDPLNVVVTFLAGNDGTDLDALTPGAVVKTITVPWSSCSYDAASKLLTIDFSSDRAEWFRAAAGTTYWLSVQPTVYDDLGSFTWDWSTDSAYPSTASSQGASVAILNSSGAWVHEGRWWNPGDALNDPGWTLQTYSGTLPSSVQSTSGTTCTDGQRLDLNFELFGGVTQAAVALSGEDMAFLTEPYVLTVAAPTGPAVADIASYLVDWGDGSTPAVIAAEDFPADRQLTHTYPYTVGESYRTIVVTLRNADNEVLGQDRLTIFVDPVEGQVYPDESVASNSWTEGRQESYRNSSGTVNKRVADDFVVDTTTDIQQITVNGELTGTPTGVVITFMADSESSGDLDSHSPSAVLKTFTVPWGTAIAGYGATFSGGVLTVDFSSSIYAGTWFRAVEGVRYWVSVQPVITDGSFKCYWNNTPNESGPAASGYVAYTTLGAAAATYYASLGEWVHQGRWWHPADGMRGDSWFVRGYQSDLPASVQYTEMPTTCTDGERLDVSMRLYGTAPTTSVEQRLYWDPQHTMASAGAGGGAGTWDATTANWYDADTNAYVAWSAGSVAVFQGTAGTVTISGSVNATEVVASVDGYTFNGGTISLPSAKGVIDVASGTSLTVNSTIAGGTLNKTGSGTLVLGATSNTYSGGTVLADGKLSVDHDNLGTASSLVSFVGGTLRVTGATMQSLGSHSINSTSFDGGFEIANAYNTFTVSQSLSGSGGLEKTGEGMLMLTGTETYTGWTIVSAGTVYLAHDLAGRSVATAGEMVGPGAPNFYTVNLSDLVKLQGSYTIDADTQLTASGQAIQASDPEMAILYSIAGTVQVVDHADEVITYTPSPANLSTYTDPLLANVNGMSIWITVNSSGQYVTLINDGGGVSGTGQADAAQYVTLEQLTGDKTQNAVTVSSSKTSGPGDSNCSCSCSSGNTTGSSKTGTAVSSTGKLVTDPLENVSSPDANGQNFSIAQLGWLRVYGSGSETVVQVVSQSGNTQKWTGSSLVAENPGKQGTLTWDSATHTYTETDLDGTQFVFAWVGASGYQPGQLVRRIPASGTGAVTYTYDLANNQWSTYTDIGDGWFQKATYTLDAATGKVIQQEVTNLQGSISSPTATVGIGKVVYTWYGDGSSSGNSGDLQLIQSFSYDTATAAYELLSTTYYRYYTGAYDATTNPGLNDYIKSIVTGDAAQRLLTANGLSATSSTLASQLDALADSALDAYADQYFEYTATGAVRVMNQAGTGCSCAGGTGENSFTYTYSTYSVDMNAWYSKQVQTIGSSTSPAKTITTYNNSEGDLLLQDVTDSAGTHWITYKVYDDYGHVLYEYQPSAVSSYSINATTGQLDVVLNAHSGVVNVYEYYGSDDLSTGPSDPGGALGYLQRSGVQNGTAGTPVWQTAVDYIAKTVNGVTVYYTHSVTQYENDAGTATETTTYSYTFYETTSGPAVKTMTTTYATVSTAEHGSGTATSTTDVYDTYGRTVWSRDAAGVISYTEYDSATGAVVKQIEDADLTATGQFTSAALAILPSGWSTPADAGQNRVSTRIVDSQGRTVKTVDAEGNVTWTVYNDAAHETRVYSGWHQDASGHWLATGTVQVYREDWANGYTESLTYAWTDADGFDDYLNADDGPSGQESLTDSRVVIQSLSRSVLNSSGQVVSSLQYTSLTGTSYSQSTAAFGTAGVNYLQTDYYYDRLGRLYSTHNSDGTVVDTFYDAMNHVTAVWQGTDDIPTVDYNGDGVLDPRDYRTWVKTNGTAVEKTDAGVNMYLVSTSTYNKDGQVLESKTYYDATSQTAGLSYTTEYAYDWRNRLTYSLSTSDFLTQYVYDNLGRVTATYGYANASITYATIDGNLYGVSVSYASGSLRSRSETLYDALGRTYESRVYEVDSTTGVAGDYLATDYWYDARGYAAKSQTGAGTFQKYAYDSLGNLVFSYISYDTDEAATDYAAALNVTGDTVIEQSQVWYDQLGRTVASAVYQRLPSDTSSTGALTATNSYVTASVAFYDAIGRTIESVNYGRVDVTFSSSASAFFNTDGTLVDADDDLIPDAAQGTMPSPYAANGDSASDTYIVSQIHYIDTAASGPIVDTIDNLGRKNETQYDLAGRTVRTIQNYVNGTVEETDTQSDITVEYQYDSLGRLATMTAYNAKDTGNGVEAQATKYLYTSTFNTTWQTAVVYPDSADTLTQDSTTKIWTISSGSDHTASDYDRLGRVIRATDQRGVAHDYSFDSAGRLSADTVDLSGEHAGQNVDNSVLAVVTTYDDMGRVRTVTNYDTADSEDWTSGHTVNQIRYAYDSWGNLAQEWQAHDGPVDTVSTASVQYVYVDGATSGVAKYVRLTDVIYPNGRDVQYGYGATGETDDIMSRLATITDSTGADVEYSYLGAGTIVEEDNVQARIKLSYLDSSGDVSRLDRFGRVVDQVWEQYHLDGSGNEVVDDVLDGYAYTYDRAGNRTSKANMLDSSLSETYEYDDLDRLVEWARGGSQQKVWTLDSLGNNLDAGTYNAANEATPTGMSGDLYDQAGNMTTLQSGDTAKYDAWNRLVQVENASGIVEKYEYDAAGRRVQVFSSFSGTGENTTATVEDDFYVGQQIVESHATTGYNLEDKEGTAAGGYQTIWSPRYIDAPILRDTLNTAGTSIVTAERVLYLADANYNVTGLVKYDSGSSEWNVVERYTYTPYGEVTYRDADWDAYATQESQFANTTLYTGRELRTETGLYYYRARFYDAGLERFVNRDPIEADINRYRYCGDNPTLRFDPSGLKWIVKRDGQSLAECCRENAGDTEAALANQIGLDAGDITKWLTKKDGRFFVPNTIYAVWAGEDVLKIPGINLNLGKGAVKWNDDVQYLQKRGFNVASMDAPGGFVGMIGAASQQKVLHGLFFWGHGAPDLIANKEGTWIASYAAIDGALQYKMGFVMLNACFSDHKAGDANITYWFPNKPFQTQFFRGPLVAGGHDLVSANGAFRGSKGILSPFQRLPIFNQMKHNFVFSHHWHPSDALKPGDQETKP